MKYGYARISTSGQDLEVRVKALKAEECGVIYQEKFTGTKMDRPELNELIDVICEGDTLVVTKLDRLVWNTKEGIEIIEMLFSLELNVGLLENTTIGRFFLQTLLAVAEIERNMIIERTQEGKAIAKIQPAFRIGRPNKYGKKQIEHDLILIPVSKKIIIIVYSRIEVNVLQAGWLNNLVRSIPSSDKWIRKADNSFW